MKTEPPHLHRTHIHRQSHFSLTHQKKSHRWVHKLSVKPLSRPASAHPDFYILFNAVGQSLSPPAPEWEQRGLARPNKCCVCLLCLLFCVCVISRVGVWVYVTGTIYPSPFTKAPEELQGCPRTSVNSPHMVNQFPQVPKSKFDTSPFCWVSHTHSHTLTAYCLGGHI